LRCRFRHTKNLPAARVFRIFAFKIRNSEKLGANLKREIYNSANQIRFAKASKFHNLARVGQI
jgi:hypothetical protein